MHERLTNLSRSALAAVVAALLLLAPGLAAAIEVEPPSIRQLSAAQIALLKKGETIRSMDTNMPFRGEGRAGEIGQAFVHQAVVHANW